MKFKRIGFGYARAQSRSEWPRGAIHSVDQRLTNEPHDSGIDQVKSRVFFILDGGRNPNQTILHEARTGDIRYIVGQYPAM